MKKVVLMAMVLVCGSAGANSIHLVAGATVNPATGERVPATLDYGFLGGLEFEFNPEPQWGVTTGVGIGAVNIGGRYYLESERGGLFVGARAASFLLLNTSITGLAGYRLNLGDRLAFEAEGGLSLGETSLNWGDGSPMSVSTGLLPSLKVRWVFRL